MQKAGTLGRDLSRSQNLGSINYALHSMATHHEVNKY